MDCRELEFRLWWLHSTTLHARNRTSNSRVSKIILILTVTLTPGEELFIRQQPVKMVIADEQVSKPPQVIVKIRRETLVNIAVNIKKMGLDSCGASVSYFVGLLQ